MAQAAASMADMRRDWWVFLVEGIVATLFGLFTIVHPDITFQVLGVYTGLFLLVWGVMSVIGGIKSSSYSSVWLLQLIMGVLLLGIGVYLMQRPGLSIATFITYVAIAFGVRGVFDLVTAFTDESDNKPLMIVSGLFSILASIIIWRYPVQGTLAFVWVLGLYALVTGPIMIAMSLKLKET